MLRRIIAWSALIAPLALAAAAPAAGAVVRSPPVTTRTAAVAVAQPVLRLGSRSGAVVTLQRRLSALHYFDLGAADGVFGAGTYHAVVAFQKVQGLTRDGVAGPATWARLARPYVPAPRYRLATASLEVNLARQVVYYVRSRTVQHILDSSTGSGAWYYSQGRWPGRSRRPAGSASTGATQAAGSRAARLDVPSELLLRRLRPARHDLSAGVAPLVAGLAGTGPAAAAPYPSPSRHRLRHHGRQRHPGYGAPGRHRYGKALKPIPVGASRNPDAIAVTPDGTMAYAVNQEASTVTPIRTATNKALKPIQIPGWGGYTGVIAI